MHVFACIQSSIVSLRVFNQQLKGYVVDACNIKPTNENIHNITFLVVYMLSGKAIAWPVHAYFIVDAALNALIFRRVLNASLPCQPETPESNDENDPDIAETADVSNSQYLDEARTFYKKIMCRSICSGEAYFSDALENH